MTTLAGKSIALSAGVAPDLKRLGVPAQEIDRAILAICGSLIRSGATVIYSGDLRPEGFTFKLFRHLAGLYAGQDVQPFSLFMPEHAARRLNFEQLSAAAVSTASVSTIKLVIQGELVCVRPDENGLLLISNSGRHRATNDHELEVALGETSSELTAESLSAARAAVTRACDARVLIGGKMGLVDDADDHFDGDLPGIIEEAIQTLQAGKLVFPLSAFGGAARDLSIELGLLPASERVPRGLQDDRYATALELASTFKNSEPVLQVSSDADFLHSDHVDYVGHQIVRFLERTIL